MIIDFHTHAFPDKLATATVDHLQTTGNVQPQLNGTLTALLSSMESAQITQSVLCSVATSPQHFHPIVAWSQEIRSEKIVPLPSLHPDDPHWHTHLLQVQEAGFHGIKMHPYYQGFSLLETRLYPLYEEVSRLGLLLVVHSGYDPSFGDLQRATPQDTAALIDDLPELKLVATHLGGWKDWDNVERHLVGKPLYMEISFALKCLSRTQARRILTNHPEEYLLFGSDSPWDDQSLAIQRLRDLHLGPGREKMILTTNGQRLLKNRRHKREKEQRPENV